MLSIDQAPRARLSDLAARREGQFAATGPRVLIVEGDTAITELLTLLLGEAGYRVERASSPHEALALLCVRGPDAFDLVLSEPFARPPTEPYTWLDRIRAWTSADVVICARHRRDAYADHKARGYAAFLEEPFAVDDLLALVFALAPVPTVAES